MSSARAQKTVGSRRHYQSPFLTYRGEKKLKNNALYMNTAPCLCQSLGQPVKDNSRDTAASSNIRARSSSSSSIPGPADTGQDALAMEHIDQPQRQLTGYYAKPTPPWKYVVQSCGRVMLQGIICKRAHWSMGDQLSTHSVNELASCVKVLETL